jgi:hypothetical protein
MPEAEENWRAELKVTIAVAAIAAVVSVALWFALYRVLPVLRGMDQLGARMLVALKCLALATLFALVAGIEAVAHERLQSAAFNPLAGHQTKRLQVNLRYLQNTIEQLIVFAVGLFGLAAYLTTGERMRAVPAITIVWILNRYAFWIGYHRSVALRGLGLPGQAIGVFMLLYVVARIGDDLGGTAGTIMAIAMYLVLEAVLAVKTR